MSTADGASMEPAAGYILRASSWRSRERGPVVSRRRRLVGPAAGAFAIVAIAGALVSGNGRYTHLAIALLLAAFAGLVVLARETLRDAESGAERHPVSGVGDEAGSAGWDWERVLAVSLLLFLALGLATKPGEHLQGPYYRVALALVSLVLGGGVWAAFLRRESRPAALAGRLRRGRRWRASASGSGCCGSRRRP